MNDKTHSISTELLYKPGRSPEPEERRKLSLSMNKITSHLKSELMAFKIIEYILYNEVPPDYEIIDIISDSHNYRTAQPKLLFTLRGASKCYLDVLADEASSFFAALASCF